MKKSKAVLLGFSGTLLLTLLVAFTAPAWETHENQKLIRAPKNIAWEVMADVANYHHYATGISAVEIVSGQGLGMVRSCSQGEASWTETCILWDEGSAYAFDVNTEEGFPFPFNHFKGTWSLKEVQAGETLLIVRFDYQFSQRWMKWFYSGKTHLAMDDGSGTLLGNWEDKILEVHAKGEKSP
ncbi:SRPBCC family protein [Flavobacteriaceae bacterium 3-367]